ncbi:ATP-dependent protease ATPase subunit HslU [uncultured Cytophaga sp.]|uniref:ATP-dependent protease ATPase subunit HslU n=1 Tax=uncultured Cytophaga sp. TaxID=160238 RepID=UPI0026188CA6|nr:ATP-dependent protease ATPase subunit HslU [uncultured Cytophaga sp.]
MTALNGLLTPTEIVAELDKYIIGQADAKRNVAIALRNRWRRMHANEDMRSEIMPNNILLIGPTGVGKTEIARRLAKLADAPFTKVEASKFTEVGYVGRDVESMVRDLVEQAVNMVKSQKKEEVKIKAAQVVEDIILDLLIPPVKSSGMGFKNTSSAHVTEEGEMPTNEDELNERTRELFREKIRSGELDERKIEINVPQNGPGIGVVGGAMDEASMMNIQEMIGNMMPKKTKKRKLSIAEARKVLMEEESSKLIDMDDVKEEAILKAQNTGIIFIDEIDKVASSKKGNGPDVSREGVQRDLLPIVEGSAVNTKYGIVHTDHILFIAAGAFHMSKPSDLIPELQGRFPIRVELNSLTQADFYHILKEPKNALTRQYQALLASENVDIQFEDDALKAIAEIAFELNVEVENIGARRLHTVMSHLLNELLFEVPDIRNSDFPVIIDGTYVSRKMDGLVQNRDLSQFIL